MIQHGRARSVGHEFVLNSVDFDPPPMAQDSGICPFFKPSWFSENTASI